MATAATRSSAPASGMREGAHTATLGFHDAACTGSLAEVRHSLEGGQDVDKRNVDGDTALHLAASHGHHEVCAVLVAAGADVKAADATHSTPLQLAALHGHVEVCKLLLEKGAVVDAAYALLQLDADNGHYEDHEVCSAPIAANVGVNASTGTAGSFTPLHLAVLSGHPDVCKVLLATGAKSRQSASPGQVTGNKRLLHIAADCGHHQVCEVLLAAGANVNASNRDGDTPLFTAVYKGHHEVCETLLAAGASPNAASQYTGIGALGETLLHTAALRGFPAICTILLAEGARVNAVDSVGCTPLHYAAQCGKCEAGGILLAAGADVHALDNTGKTPLGFIISEADEDADVFPLRRLLVAYGAPMEHLPSKGLTAQLPAYCAAVRTGAWTRRVAALTAWVYRQDAADGVPSLAARAAAALAAATRSTRAAPADALCES